MASRDLLSLHHPEFRQNWIFENLTNLHSEDVSGSWRRLRRATPAVENLCSIYLTENGPRTSTLYPLFPKSSSYITALIFFLYAKKTKENIFLRIDDTNLYYKFMAQNRETVGVIFFDVPNQLYDFKCRKPLHGKCLCWSSPCHENQIRSAAAEDSPDPNGDASWLNPPDFPCCTKNSPGQPSIYHQRILFRIPLPFMSGDSNQLKIFSTTTCGQQLSLFFLSLTVASNRYVSTSVYIYMYTRTEPYMWKHLCEYIYIHT